jgi:hypothetical protein
MHLPSSPCTVHIENSQSSELIISSYYHLKKKNTVDRELNMQKLRQPIESGIIPE